MTFYTTIRKLGRLADFIRRDAKPRARRTVNYICKYIFLIKRVRFELAVTTICRSWKYTISYNILAIYLRRSIQVGRNLSLRS